VSLKYLENNDILLFYNSKSVFYYKNYWKTHSKLTQMNISPGYISVKSDGFENSIYSANLDDEFEKERVLLPMLNNSIVEFDQIGGQLVKIGINGNTYYELVPEFINGEWIITPYVSGTYVAPPEATITFQPINN
jgi:hypothetical protein